jgi:catechol 2,3-dioxygenase-like lactoylglutathione lyase family enzyme
VEPHTSRVLNAIGQIAIVVQDVDRAADYYQTKLGLPFLFRAGTLAFFDCGGVRLMLTVPEAGSEDQATSVLYFTVDDIHSAYETLVARGVQFVDTPHLIATMETYDLWMAFFRDSEQNLMGIMGEIPRT